VAVLAVLWFHSGLSGLSGGFAGVDVFFVISGYLIAGIVAREHAAGSFSFAHFYERRVRRIAPALVTVILATLVAGYALMLPEELVKLGESALAAMGMVPNFYFLNEADGGYFGLTKRVSPPLLHTWSLGVEEQFYLLFPAFLLIAARLGRLRLAIGLVALGSFALYLLASRLASPAAFFLLPTRAWELALGAMLAVGAFTVPARFGGVAALAGLLAILFGYVAIGAEGVSPAWMIAIPVIGSAMLIGSGGQTAVGRLLSVAPLVWVGRISYSLYLWHWPVFAMLRQWRVEMVLPVEWAVMGMLLSLLLAWASYRWIEQPARRTNVPFRRVLLSLGGTVLAVVAMSVVAIAREGLPERYDPKILMLAAQAQDSVPLAESCDSVPFDRLEERCKIGDGSATALLWGDSHAAAESVGITAALGQTAILITKNGCPPALEPADYPPNRCVLHNRAVRDWLTKHPEIKTVVLAASWPQPRKGKAVANWRDTQAAVDALAGRDVLVVAGVPRAGMNVPWTSALRAARGMPPPSWPCPRPLVPLERAFIVDLSAAFCAHPRPWMHFVDGAHASKTANEEIIGPAMQKILADRALRQQAGNKE
jgi:peptidoglycan/LPS O-acetylase OafA/YrhL